MILREKAAEVLNVPATAEAGDVRAAFLKRLEADGFVPPEDATWAARTLGESRLLLGVDSQSEAAAAERDAVERFAKEYWSLVPASRLARYRELLKALSDAVAMWRLRSLEAGLEVDASPHENPLVEEVAAAIRAMYVMTPRNCSIERCRWLEAVADRRADLRDAARRLRMDDPKLGRLVPALHTELGRKEQFQPVPEMDEAILEAEREATTRRRMRKAEAEVLAAYRTTPSQMQEGSGCGGWSVYIGILIAVFLARTCHSLTRDTTQPTQFQINQNQKWVPPKIDPKIEWDFTAREILAFEEYERSRNLGDPSAKMPLNYAKWMLAGKPRTPRGGLTR